MNRTEIKEARKTSPVIKPVIFAVIVLALISMPLWGSRYSLSVAVLVLLYLSLAQMWNLLSGYTGLTSLGQQAFIGIGGYAIAVTTQAYKMPLVAGFIVAGVVAVVFALVISAPIFKMSGVYFTIGTWIIAEALYIFFVNWKFVNYGIGYPITAAYRIRPEVMYWISLVVGLGSIVIVVLVLRSRLGLGLMAIRDNAASAEVRGVRLYRSKLIIFLIAAIWVAITGCLLFMNQAYIIPSSAFSIDWTIAMVFMVIIGGSGTIEGPVIGAIVYIILRQYLYNFPGISNIILGVIAIIIILIAPKGIMGFINKRFNLDIFSIRRKPKRK
ncbi:branched-chain amino acid ABC transporter permease [Parasporobacterium paucivorans]|uniref:Branched-chain amino acid transport system permease protein n=1 Tax=Parasporobacterium paucivorans DSM 15970 TaxID=1122934 RepID=A0A1M6E4W1_9FIRM|nr:branched-chain amino acid ABC transporter permease [Parasporobacterium paucivorans]SHI80445.1 branched-chain amino acid transport system permease protein [Parasporobacterium paucivorans DSM 15970]